MRRSVSEGFCQTCEDEKAMLDEDVAIRESVFAEDVDWVF